MEKKMNIAEITSLYKLDKYLKEGGDINAETDKGNILLTLLLDGNRQEALLNKIVKKGINVNFVTSYGRNVLFYDLPFSTTQLLIQKGINLSQKDRDDLTPLFFYKSSKIMKLLIDNGCDPLHTDSKGRTFAHDPKFSNFLSKIKRNEDEDNKIKEDYTSRVELALKYISPGKVDDYGRTLSDYISFNSLSEKAIKDIIGNILKYDHALFFEKEYHNFIKFFPIVKENFLLGEVMLNHFPDFLYSLTKDNQDLQRNIVSLPSDNTFLGAFKDRFMKEIIVKNEKEILMNNLKEKSLPISRKRI